MKNLEEIIKFIRATKTLCVMMKNTFNVYMYTDSPTENFMTPFDISGTFAAASLMTEI